MDGPGECSAFRLGHGICANGFPQTAYCCGQPSSYVPLCLKDEVPEHLCDDSGRMRFATAAHPASDPTAGSSEGPRGA
jgi:hypothetical protein